MGSLSPWGFQGEGSLGSWGSLVSLGFIGFFWLLLESISLSLSTYIYMCEICIRTRRSKSHMLNPGGLGLFGSLGCACVSVWALWVLWLLWVLESSGLTREPWVHALSSSGSLGPLVAVALAPVASWG